MHAVIYKKLAKRNKPNWIIFTNNGSFLFSFKTYISIIINFIIIIIIVIVIIIIMIILVSLLF